jgi:hypothetical protein
MNDIFNEMCNEVVVAYFELFSPHLRGGTEETSIRTVSEAYNLHAQEMHVYLKQFYGQLKLAEDTVTCNVFTEYIECVYTDSFHVKSNIGLHCSNRRLAVTGLECI